MYIDPFICGVLATLLVEMALIFVFAYKNTKKK